MKALQKVSLVDQAVSSLMKYIHDNDLPPGSSLPSELQLAKTFGVSRPVVREALRALQGRAVVNLVNGKGAIIRPLDGKAFNDFFMRAIARPDFDRAVELEEARNGLETQCAYLAATRRKDEHLERLDEILAKMRNSMDDTYEYWSLNSDFHKVIAEATGNKMMSLLVESLQDALTEVFSQMKIKLVPRGLWAAMHPFHESIVNNIRLGDAEAASKANFEHLDLALKMTREEGTLESPAMIG